MSIIPASLSNIAAKGQVRLNGQTCKVATNKLKNFTNEMVSKGFEHESIRKCDAKEVTQYLQAINGILPKKAAQIKVPVDTTHTYQFMQAHGAVEILDKTAGKEVIALVEKAKNFI